MSERTNIRLDEQARTDADLIARHFNLRSTSAAVRYALRDLARRVDAGALGERKATDRGTDGDAAGEGGATQA